MAGMSGSSGPFREDGPALSDFYGLCDRQRVFEFDAKISDCAVHLGVAEQELNSAQVAGLPVDLRHLGSPH